MRNAWAASVRPTWPSGFQADFGRHGTRGQQVPTLRLLFQVARRGAWAAIDHPALGLEVLSVLRLVIPSCFNIYIEEFFLYYNQLNLIV